MRADNPGRALSIGLVVMAGGVAGPGEDAGVGGDAGAAGDLSASLQVLRLSTISDVGQLQREFAL